MIFQALCLGLAASLVGLLAGYALAVGPFHQSPAYLAEAFTLGTRTVIGTGPLVLALGGGILATCLASALTLLDLRGGRALDAAHFADGASGDALGRSAQLRLALAAGGVLALASATFALWSSLSLAALMALALVCVLAVPLALGARAGSRPRAGRAPAAADAAAGRADLAARRDAALARARDHRRRRAVRQRRARRRPRRPAAGIGGFSRSYTADASIWVNPPGAYQATTDFLPGDDVAQIARVPGVSAVRSFFGGYLDLDGRRLWIIARPPGGAREVLRSQIIARRRGRRERAARRGRSDRRLAADRRRASRRRRRQPDAADPQRECPLCGSPRSRPRSSGAQG